MIYYHDFSLILTSSLLEFYDDFKAKPELLIFRLQICKKSENTRALELSAPACWTLFQLSAPSSFVEQLCTL